MDPIRIEFEDFEESIPLPEYLRLISARRATNLRLHCENDNHPPRKSQRTNRAADDVTPARELNNRNKRERNDEDDDEDAGDDDDADETRLGGSAQEAIPRVVAIIPRFALLTPQPGSAGKALRFINSRGVRRASNVRTV